MKFNPEENKTIVRRIVEEFVNKGNTGVVDELFSPNFVDHGSSFETVGGREAVKQLVETLRTGFPDLHFQIEHLIAEEDKVVAHLKGSGTHNGYFMGRPPTGKRIAFRNMTVLRISGSKVVERWNVYDIHGILGQIGSLA